MSTGISIMDLGLNEFHLNLLESELLLKIDGLNIDKVYENFVRQIGRDTLQTDSNETLKESVECAEQRQQLEKQIAVLQAKARREKQLNKQVQMNAELKVLKEELRNIV